MAAAASALTLADDATFASTFTLRLTRFVRLSGVPSRFMECVLSLGICADAVAATVANSTASGRTILLMQSSLRVMKSNRRAPAAPTRAGMMQRRTRTLIFRETPEAAFPGMHAMLR